MIYINIKKQLIFHLILKVAWTTEMVLIANKIKPKMVTLVPEKRLELTTEGGLNLKILKRLIKLLIP